MTNYKLTNSTSILRADGSYIPADPENRDYAEYLAWLAEGNTPEPVDPPTPDDLLAAAKAERQSLVDSIVVTTASGKAFDGDEESQGRMARAITALEPQETTLWVLADNTPDPAISREELREALRLAGSTQTAVWAKPYEAV